MKKQLALALILALFAGCAHRRSDLHAEITSEVIESQSLEGVTTVTTRTTEKRDLSESTTAAGDAKNALEKYRASNAPKTLSVGLTGEHQETSSTNMVRGIEALRDILQTISGH